jgi:drug/metabolite transporter (DMT)-like permease
MNKTLSLIIYSTISGLLACIVSVFMKLAFNLESINIIIRIILIILSILSNTFMWIIYSKSLQLSSNTLLANSLNKFCNFLFTTLSAYILFDEKLTNKFFIGLSFILVGILILTTNNRNDEEECSKKQL